MGFWNRWAAASVALLHLFLFEGQDFLAQDPLEIEGVQDESVAGRKVDLNARRCPW